MLIAMVWWGVSLPQNLLYGLSFLFWSWLFQRNFYLWYYKRLGIFSWHITRVLEFSLFGRYLFLTYLYFPSFLCRNLFFLQKKKKKKCLFHIWKNSVQAIIWKGWLHSFAGMINIIKHLEYGLLGMMRFVSHLILLTIYSFTFDWSIGLWWSYQN